MKAFTTAQIRNVALVGHNGAGKTSLAEALLHRAGAISRLGRVEDGTTCCDFEPEERDRGLSLSLSVAPFVWQDHKINLVDSPGYADFIGEATAALRVADLAVFVVSAVDGVEVQTEILWRRAAELGLPRLIFINKLDRERADFDVTLAQLQERFGSGVAPLELPIGQESSFRGIADLLTDRAHIYTAGSPEEQEIPDDMEELEHRVHESLIEGIVVGDDDLLERYLEGEEPSFAELESTLHDGLAAARVFPVVIGSATQEIGIDRLADFLVEIGPSPEDRVTTVYAADQEVEVKADPAAEPLAFVFKTLADPYVGKLSLFKVLSGTVHSDDHLINVRSSTDERLHGLLQLRGKEQEPASELAAGDIGAVPKLNGTQTGDTLAPKGKPVRLQGIEPPAATLAIAVEPKTQGDEDKLAPALHRIQDEDLALRIQRIDETHQTLLWGTGETHLQIALERITRKFGANVITRDVQVAYRETVTGSAHGVEGKHKKQTGGHGQFGVCFIDLEPLPRGKGFEFVNKIVGGAISRSYIPAVEKGIAETMDSGGVFGYPVVDVRVTLTDGKEHSVDSSEMAFKVAGRLAFRAAMEQAQPVVLEPVGRLEVTVPSELQGDIMGDLNSRRGHLQGTDAEDHGEVTITALVPESEMQRYTIDLRSLTGGRGRFQFRHDHYDLLPTHLVEAVRQQAEVAEHA